MENRRIWIWIRSKHTVFGLLLQSYLELITNLEGDADFNKSNTTSFTIKLGNIVTRYLFRKLCHDYCMSEVENNKKSFVGMLTSAKQAHT